MPIRDAHDDDLDAAARLMVDAYREYEPLLTPEAWNVYAADIGAVRDRGPGAELIVHDDDGSLCGAVTYYAPGAFAPIPSQWAYLRLLAVAPGARGRGVGRDLVAEVVSRARAAGAEAIGIHNAPFMKSARILYARLGFVPEPRFDMGWDDAMRDGSRLIVNAYRLPLTPLS